MTVRGVGCVAVRHCCNCNIKRNSITAWSIAAPSDYLGPYFSKIKRQYSSSTALREI
jgi:hypothetical protein